MAVWHGLRLSDRRHRSWSKSTVNRLTKKKRLKVAQVDALAGYTPRDRHFIRGISSEKTAPSDLREWLGFPDAIGNTVFYYPLGGNEYEVIHLLIGETLWEVSRRDDPADRSGVVRIAYFGSRGVVRGVAEEIFNLIRCHAVHLTGNIVNY